jgi:hypothetical protein
MISERKHSERRSSSGKTRIFLIDETNRGAPSKVQANITFM